MAFVLTPWPDWLGVWEQSYDCKIHTRIKTEFSNWACTFDTKDKTRSEILDECWHAYRDILARDAILRRITRRLKE